MAPATSNYHHLARQVFHGHTGSDLDTWLLERRERGLSWRRLSAELHYLTDGDVSPAVATLVEWHNQAHRQAQAGQAVA